LTCSAIGWHPTEYSDSFSVGELNANCEAKIMDDAGKNEVPQGERGEIWMRAPNVMKGYWNRPDATRETITPDGWLKTGDIAFVDKTGKFFIVDRKKVRTTDDIEIVTDFI
jgi:4-coumarate--CoA ligase